MKSEKIKIVFIVVAVLWGVYALDFLLGLISSVKLNSFGIIPRTTRGLIGIVASPFLHGGIFHLIGNTIPLLVLGMLLVSFYEEIAPQVLAIIVFVGGALVWVFARKANHIGASGVIYGIAAFLIAYGILKKKLVPILIAAAVAFLYGGSMLTGLLPFNSYISWEGHLLGAAAGVLAAFSFIKQPQA